MIGDVFPVADAVIVGTSLKVDGTTWNEVDPDRAARLMNAARARARRRGDGLIGMARKTRVYSATDFHGSSKSSGNT